MNIKWNASGYQERFSFVPLYGESVISLMKSPKGTHVVDLGCGNGALTEKLVQKGYIVTGIDDSEDMLTLARKAYPNIPFERGNAIDFNHRTEAIFSNAVLHWIDSSKQQALLDNIAGNLEKGGEFVFEMGGKDCAKAVHSSLQGLFEKHGYEYSFNFFFPTIGEYASMLEKAGFRVTDAFWFERPTKQEGTLSDWIAMFNSIPFARLPKTVSDTIIEECEKALKATLFIDGAWHVDYTRLRMRAEKR